MSLKTKRERIGLIAGNGKFPILFAKIAKQKDNVKIITAAIKGDTSKILDRFVDKICWISAGELGKMLDYFKEERIKRVVMAGQVNPDNLFDKRVSLDGDLEDLFTHLKDRRADTIFNAIANRLKNLNINLIEPIPYLADFMPTKGVLTESIPTEKEWEDIYFGKDVAKAIGYVDIGQTVVVKQKAILAIEAMEGTDKAIIRGGQIGRGDVVVIKVSKPNQDMRFDIPVVGLKTMKFLIKAKARCLAIEAEKTLFLDRKECIKLANKRKLCIVAI